MNPGGTGGLLILIFFYVVFKIMSTYHTNIQEIEYKNGEIKKIIRYYLSSIVSPYEISSLKPVYVA